MSAVEERPVERYQRVSAARPCAICGKPDWCVCDPAAGVALCCRVESATFDPRFGAYRHDVPSNSGEVDELRVIELGDTWSGDMPDVEAEARDVLYRELARLCDLSAEDRGELRDHRGIADETAIVGRFFTYPPAGHHRDRVLRDLERFAKERGGVDLEVALWRLPGVYCTPPAGGGRGFVNHLAGRAGLAILVPDAADRAVAVQVRARDGDRQPGEPRYTYVSARATPSHAPVYVARPPGRIRDHDRVIITEGAFKALAAARHYGCLAIGLPGISIQRQVVPTLAHLRDRGDLDMAARVCVAFDEEPDNPNVARRRDELVRRLLDARWEDVALLRWDGARAAKLDDALTAGLDIREEPVSAEREGGRGPSQAARLIALGKRADLFHDADGNAWATVPVNGHHETHGLNSRGFQRWLQHALYVGEEQAASKQALADAIGVLEGLALWSGRECEVATRLAGHGDAIYLDLGDESWRVVRITANGWRAVPATEAPVRFRRPSGLLPLPVPHASEAGMSGDLARVRTYLNLPVDDEDRAWRLLVAWLVGALRPTGPYPLLQLEGEQGSAKTTTARVLRALVDPNAAPVRAEPREGRDLAIAANNAWVLCYDNLTHLSPWLSNGLCRLSTGGGYATRALYENDAETIFEAQRPVILTGIETVPDVSDLLDRTLIVRLPTIPQSSRRAEAPFWRAFERDRPAILAALLDAVSAALAELPHVRLAELPRMADFAQWATAAEPALGWQSGAFLSAYADNRAEATEVALEASAVATAIMEHLPAADADGAPLTMTAGEWLAWLEQQMHSAAEREARAHGEAEAPSAWRPPRGWPAKARGFTAEVMRMAPNLRERGINVRRPPQRTNRGWPIIIERISPSPSSGQPHNGECGERPSQPSQPSQRATNACEFGANVRDGLSAASDDLFGDDDQTVTVSRNRHTATSPKFGSRDGCDGCDDCSPARPGSEEDEQWRL